MRRLSWRLMLLGGIFLGTVSANWNDTSTGINLDRLPHFPLTKIRSGWLKAGSRLMFDAIRATASSGDEREVQLRGLGRSGKPWVAHIFGLDEIWRADLDGNGTQDYVLFASGPYFNGRTTPLFSLSILLMDREGMPTPFFTVVYHGENGDGIKHLVDLNHDGHAELLISTFDEITSDARVGAFCSGHWTNQLYRFEDFGPKRFAERLAVSLFRSFTPGAIEAQNARKNRNRFYHSSSDSSRKWNRQARAGEHCDPKRRRCQWFTHRTASGRMHGD